jgi:hypothetical protein
MENKSMTAVDWLEEVYNQQGRILPAQFEQAKEIEKQQIEDAFDECGQWQDKYSDSEHYYTQTYGK